MGGKLLDFIDGSKSFKGTSGYQNFSKMKNAIGASNKADLVFNVVENGVSRKVKFTDIQAFATSKGEKGIAFW